MGSKIEGDTQTIPYLLRQSSRPFTTIPVGRAPFAITYSRTTGRIYVANVNCHDLSLIAAESLKVLATVIVGVAASPEDRIFRCPTRPVALSQ